MIAKTIGALLIVVAFISCEPHRPSVQNETTQDTMNATQVEYETTAGVKTEDDLNYAGCSRGQAESVIRSTVYPNAIFKLNADNLTGTETVDLETARH